MTEPRRFGKRRLFFALWPDAEIRQQIAAASEAAIRQAGARAVPPGNYHITVAFLGAVSSGSVAEIISVAHRARFLPFAVQLDRAGYWSRSQLAWMAPAQCPLGLSALVDDLWNKLAGLGFHHEARQYRPHVTLGRKVGDNFAVQLPAPISWPVESFVLAESKPGPSGSVYTVLEEFSAGA